MAAVLKNNPDRGRGRVLAGRIVRLSMKLQCAPVAIRLARRRPLPECIVATLRGLFLFSSPSSGAGVLGGLERRSGTLCVNRTQRIGRGTGDADVLVVHELSDSRHG